MAFSERPCSPTGIAKRSTDAHPQKMPLGRLVARTAGESRVAVTTMPDSTGPRYPRIEMQWLHLQPT
jgi:hypothetical protein